MQFWKDLENAVRYVLQTKKRTVLGYLEIEKKGTWLTIRLPSGRYLCYAGARLIDGREIQYLGVNQYSRKWGFISTYGGKLAENMTQAFCRDIIAHGVLTADKEGYKPVTLVHDEDVTETPDTNEFTHQHLSQLLSEKIKWAPGLPLDADGFEAYRYRK